MTEGSDQGTERCNPNLEYLEMAERAHSQPCVAVEARVHIEGAEYQTSLQTISQSDEALPLRIVVEHDVGWGGLVDLDKVSKTACI